MLDFSKLPMIMGILNYTKDSFSDGGMFNTPSSAVIHALKMEAEGADLIDFGACSTRPGSTFVSEKDELSILETLIPLIKKSISRPLSVDSFYSDNLIRCISLGVDVLNDVGGVYNTKTAEAVRNADVNWIIMHGGVLAEKNKSHNIVDSVQAFFDSIYALSSADGIADKVILDPGFGFNKNTDENRELLASLDKLDTHGLPLFCALSRKRFVGALSEDENEKNRLGGTLAANILAVQKGADIIRSHEVFNHRKALNFLSSMK